MHYSVNIISYSHSNPSEYCITWAVGHYFNISVTTWCLTTLTTFKIPAITWAAGHSFNLYVGLHGPGWLYVLGITPRGDLPLWTPRARVTDLGQGPNLRRGVRAGSLRATEPRTREKTRARKRKKCRSAKTTHLYIVTRFPFGMCITWNPWGDPSWKETRR